MPFSLDSAQPQEKITEEYVIYMLGYLVRAADDENDFDDWIEKKFKRNDQDRFYIIGQLLRSVASTKLAL